MTPLAGGHARDYCGKLALDLDTLPEVPKPNADLVAKALKSTSDSGVGPNGICFAAYRSTATFFVPIALRAWEAMAAGERPPLGFNFGLLHLLPKTGTSLPQDTRPISVTNSDNRILAKAMVLAITPFLQAVLKRSQQGFIPGRSGAAHINALNRFFFGAAQNDTQHKAYLLFLDTSKAFDSIDHDFVVAALERLCLPRWVINVVEAMLDNVEVTPVIRGAASGIWIHILRGVKQGCPRPLSPLLFAICYDTLLTKLHHLCPDVLTCGFADDLTLGAARFREFHLPMRLISEFAEASGLGVNMHKTAVICSHDVDLQAKITTCPWPTLAAKQTHVYLGILMGRSVTRAGVYEAALTKVEDRAWKWHDAIKRMSLQRRIITFNAFLLPILSYIGLFFPLPVSEHSPTKCAVRRVTRMIEAHIIFQGGTGFPYFHLYQPSGRFGPSPPLVDIWMRTRATAASATDLTRWDGANALPAIDLSSYNSTMLIEELRSHAGCHLVAEDLGGSYEPSPVFKADAFGPSRSKKARAVIYKRMIYTYYHYDHQDPDLDNKFRTKLGFQNAPALVQLLHAGFAALSRAKPRPVPSYVHNNQFLLTLNALPTERRLLHHSVPDAATRRNGQQPACHFCGADRGGDCDDVKHIYGRCPVVAQARQAFADAIQLDLSTEGLGAPNDLGAAMLLFEHNSGSNARAIAIFNAHVWFQRKDYFRFSKLTGEDRVAKAVNRITTASLLEWETLNSAKPPTTSTFGSAGKRTKAQQEAARKYADNILADIDRDSTVVAFTDGSAKGNPGPTGAGALVHYPAASGLQHTEELCAGLGTGTNNMGELWAIGMAIQHANRRHEEGFRGTSKGVILTDSAYSRGCLAQGWNSTTNNDLQQAVLKLIQDSPLEWTILWVPGHAGVEENEIADMIANRGSSRSADGRGLTDINDRIQSQNFL